MIEIMEYKHINKGALQGIVSFKIKPFANQIIRRAKYFVKGDKKWIGIPGEEYEKDGQKKTYAFMIWEDMGVTQNILQKTIDALEIYLAKNPPKPTEIEYVAPSVFQTTQTQSPAYGVGSNGAYSQDPPF